MIIQMVSGWDSNYKEMGEYTSSVKKLYCQQWNYQFSTADCLPHEGYYGWKNVEYISQVLKDCDWLFWTEPDAIITNTSIPLTNFIFYGFDLVLTIDANGINTGQFFCRNCSWVQEWLNKVIGSRVRFEKYTNPEQTALCNLLQPYWAKVRILPQRSFNSFPYKQLYPEYSFPEGQWEIDDFICHLPAISNGIRMEFFKCIAENNIFIK
jgi:hypothetical protein